MRDVMIRNPERPAVGGGVSTVGDRRREGHTDANVPSLLEMREGCHTAERDKCEKGLMQRERRRSQNHERIRHTCIPWRMTSSHDMASMFDVERP